MSRIEILPDELILEIASLLPHESSLAALALTNRRLHRICNPCLYRYNVLYHNSSALDWAAQHGRLDTVQNTLSASAPLPKKQANLHRTRALAFAIAQGNRRIAEILLRNDAPPQFHRAAIPTSFEDDHEEWVQPLLVAVQRNSLELVELLVDYGADVNVQCSEYPRTGFAKLFDRVLFWAVEESHEAIVDLLLEHGADPEIADMMGSPPLTYAVERGNQAIVRSLLDHGANPHSAVDHRGKKLVSFRQMSQSIRTQLQEAEEKWPSKCQC